MEALTASQDSENRITVGGKRKSSSRRSSILKATKSPLKAGILEDLDPNSLDDNGRSRSKKSRRSSGRRVSFAEKNDIKEFFVEDWKSAWTNDTKDSNLQVPSGASQGEYREPAESIQGLESLLKGDIADDNQMCRVEIEENPSADASEQTEEMEYTKCHSSVLSSTATNMDQTRLFSEDPAAIELDVTCTQQEIFFRDYPNAQLSSPDNLEHSGKMDSKSFLMSLGSKPSSTKTNEVTRPKEFSTSTNIGNAYCKRQPLGEITGMQSSMNPTQQQVSNFDDNVELTACHSYKVLGNDAPKTNRRSIYEPADVDVTSCYGPSLMRSPDKQEWDGPDDENLELTACHSYEVLDNSIPKANQKSICEPADLDVTSCYGQGLIKSPEKQVTSSHVRETDLIHGNSQEATFHRLHNSSSLNKAHELLGPGDVSALRNQTPDRNIQLTEHTGQLDVTRCYGKGILPNKTLSDAGTDQTMVFAANTDNTDLDLTVCQTQQGHTAVLPFLASPSQNYHNDRKLSFSGSSKMDSSVFLRSLNATPHCSATNNDENDDEMDLTTSGHSGAQIEEKMLDQNGPVKSKLSMESTLSCTKTNDVAKVSPSSSSFRNAYLIKNPFSQQPTSDFDENVELTVCHSQPVLDSSMQKSKRRSLYEPADIDVTSCYGPGLIQSPEEEPNHDVCKSALNLSRSLRAATTANSFIGNATLNRTQDLPGWNKTQRQSSDFNENLDLTTCHSRQFISNNSPKTNRRSLYEPADIDVTSCHGAGLVKSSDEDLDQEFSYSQPVLDKSSQKASRRSLYEPADIDVTSCYGAGLVKSSGENLDQEFSYSQPIHDESSQKASRRSLYEPADIDVTSCYGAGLVKSSGENLDQEFSYSQPIHDKSSQKASRRSLYEPADIDVTSCYGAGLVKSSGENLDQESSYSQPVLDKSSQKASRRSLYEPVDIDVTSCYGAGLVKSSGENLDQESSYSQPVLDKSSQKASRRSLYEPVDIDVTSCYGAGLVKSSGENLDQESSYSQPVLDKSSQKASRRSLYEPVDIDVTSCHGAGLVKSFAENSESTVSHSEHPNDNNTQQTNQKSLCEPAADPDATSCQGEEVVTDHFSETPLNLSKGPETTFHQVNDNATVDQAEALHDSEELLQTSRVPANSNASFESTEYSADIDVTSSHVPELNESIDDQITSDVNDRKLSIICEESVSELSKKEMSEEANVTEVEEMQNTTQSPITLKQFLDITEIAFITEVNMRRSIAPSNLVEAPKTPKDVIISSLVSKPKAACYEEAIPAIEAEITNMKEKVEQQEMELNASNPKVFMEAQSASKEELLAMQSKVRRLRSVCEKTTKREWKEGKGQMNKRILSKIQENHQALASDVHVVEESLSMVDDCLNLLDKMDSDLHEGIQSINLSLEENEKKLQEQITMVEQLETMTEALKKSEQELADLECTRSSVQSEKQELASRKEQLDVTILENEEAIRLLKNKDPRSGNAATKAISQKLDILESLQEWSLEEWNKDCARFTFLKSTLEMVVFFGSEISDSEDSSPNQEVKSIQLNFTPTEQFSGKIGKVHTVVKQAVNQDILTQICRSKKDLTKVLEHMSEIVFKSKEIGEELFRIGLSHLMSFKENSFVVEFSSLKAFVKFVLHTQLELQSYPDGVRFTVVPMIGLLSQTEIEETLNAVVAGPRYLSRLVEAADQLLNKAKPTSNKPS